MNDPKGVNTNKKEITVELHEKINKVAGRALGANETLKGNEEGMKRLESITSAYVKI